MRLSPCWVVLLKWVLEVVQLSSQHFLPQIPEILGHAGRRTERVNGPVQDGFKDRSNAKIAYLVIRTPESERNVNVQLAFEVRNGS